MNPKGPPFGSRTFFSLKIPKNLSFLKIKKYWEKYFLGKMKIFREKYIFSKKWKIYRFFYQYLPGSFVPVNLPSLNPNENSHLVYRPNDVKLESKNACLPVRTSSLVIYCQLMRVFTFPLSSMRCLSPAYTVVSALNYNLIFGRIEERIDALLRLPWSQSSFAKQIVGSMKNSSGTL